MGIDLLYAKGQMPVIVGDEADMDLLVGMDWITPETQASLVFKRGDAVYRRWIEAKVASNFADASLALFVSLSKDDDITSAYLIRRNGDPPQMLDFDQVKALMELITSAGVEMIVIS